MSINNVRIGLFIQEKRLSSVRKVNSEPAETTSPGRPFQKISVEAYELLAT